MAGVLVAALKEAFDRDSARLELERIQIEAERRRAERPCAPSCGARLGACARTAAADRGHGDRGVGALGGAERVDAGHA